MPLFGNQWFKDEAEYKRSRSSSAMRTTTRSVPEVEGLRRGFNGRMRPRTSFAGSTGDMTVYRPNGDKYIVRGSSRRESGNRTTKPRLSVDMLNALDDASRRKSYSRDFAPIGNVD